MGWMKSSSRTSPGVGFGISSVIIDDLDVIRTSLCPHETNAALLIDPDTVLTGSIAFKRLTVFGGMVRSFRILVSFIIRSLGDAQQ